MVNKQTFYSYLLVFEAVLTVSVAIAIRLTHAEMTETQLFLNFWVVWAALGVNLMTVYWLYATNDQR